MTIRQHTIDTPYVVGEVHCYSIELNGELVLFDTGPPTAVAQRRLREEVGLERLRHVVVTHCHIDHYGLAAWLARECGAEIWLPCRDAQKITHHRERLAAMDELLRDLGFDGRYLKQLRRAMDDGTVFPEFPPHFRVIEESDLPERLGFSVLPCPGHSQSDLVYAGEDWAVTGDTLLRGIFQSPLLDVDLERGERFRNYHAYCDTLGKLATLRDKRILPGHRQAVESLDATILFYVGKLLERAARLRPLADEDRVDRILEQMFGPTLREPFHIYLKASEIVFMRDFLRDPQRLRGALKSIGLFPQVAGMFAALAA